MPIEIRELVIKATVNPNDDSEKASPGNAAQGGNNNMSATEEIINTCMERIIGILKDKYER